jgi:hypothetical protein
MMPTGQTNLWQIIAALFFVWLGLKLIENFAPEWARWYIALIANSIVIYYRNQLVTFLNAARTATQKKGG